MTAGLDTKVYCHGPREEQTPAEQARLAELAKLQELRSQARAYVTSVLCAVPSDAAERMQRNYDATGYLAGGDSPSARADDSYHW